MPLRVRSPRRFWAPRVIAAVGGRERAPEGYLDVFFTTTVDSRNAGRQALTRMFARTAEPDQPTSWQTRQAQYDAVYAQCMYAKGNMVPAYGPMMSDVPPPPPGPDTSLTYGVQQQLIRLQAEGVLLALVSRNEPEDVERVRELL